MGLIYVPERKIQANFKPDFPVELNPKHPLVKYLAFAEWNGVDLFAGLPASSFSGNILSGGRGTYNSAYPYPAPITSANMSFVAGLYLHSYPPFGAGLSLSLFSQTTPSTATYASILFQLTEPGGGAVAIPFLRVQNNNIGAQFGIQGGSNIPLGVHHLAGTINQTAATKSCQLFLDGLLTNSTANIGSGSNIRNSTFSPAYESNQTISVSASGFGDDLSGILYSFAFNNLVLSAAQVQSLYQNPYQLLRPRQRPLMIPTGSGGTAVNFTGFMFQAAFVKGYSTAGYFGAAKSLGLGQATGLSKGSVSEKGGILNVSHSEAQTYISSDLSSKANSLAKAQGSVTGASQASGGVRNISQNKGFLSGLSKFVGNSFSISGVKAIISTGASLNLRSAVNNVSRMFGNYSAQSRGTLHSQNSSRTSANGSNTSTLTGTLSAISRFVGSANGLFKTTISATNLSKSRGASTGSTTVTGNLNNYSSSTGNIFTGNYISSSGVVINLSKAHGIAGISSVIGGSVKNGSSIVTGFLLRVGFASVAHNLSSILGGLSSRTSLVAAAKNRTFVLGNSLGINASAGGIRNKSLSLGALLGQTSILGIIDNSARTRGNPTFTWHASTNIFNSSSDSGSLSSAVSAYTKAVTGMVSGVSRTLGNLTSLSSLYGSALNYSIVRATQTGNLAFQLSGRAQGISEAQGTLWVLSNLYLTGPRPVWTLDYQPLHWVLD